MKIRFIERTWSYDELEHGETSGEPSVEEVNISSIEDIVDVMRNYCNTSKSPVIPGENFWLFSEFETVDYHTGDMIEKSMHIVNPTPYNIRLWHKAYALA